MNIIFGTFFFCLNLILIIYYKNLNFLKIYDQKKKTENIIIRKTKNIYLVGGTILLINIFAVFVFHIFLKLDFFNTILLDSKKEIFALYVPCILFFLLGLYDDKYNLRANTKLVLMLIIILLCIFSDQQLIITKIIINSNIIINLGKLDTLFTVFCFLVFINAMNMFDGINLQLSLYSILIFFSLFLFNFFTPYMLVLILSLFFFLYLNYNNFSFLGNSGSHLLGFLISYFLIKYYNSSLETLTVNNILIFMFLPGLDFIRVVLVRLSAGKNPFHGDNNHLHHILLKKYGLNKTLSVNFLLTFFPVYMYFYFNLNFYLLFIFFCFIYFFLTMYNNKYS